MTIYIALVIANFLVCVVGAGVALWFLTTKSDNRFAYGLYTIGLVFYGYLFGTALLAVVV